MEARYCPNCGTEVTGKFCAQCGAKYAKKDITVKFLFMAAFEMFTNWEQKMQSTLLDLFRSPGIVPFAFIEGERRKYYNPVKFVMFWAGINILICIYLHSNIGELERDDDQIAQAAQKIISNYYAFMWITCIPLMSLAPYVLFRKTERSFLNHCVVMSYLVGINLIICLPNIIVEGIWKDARPIVNFLGPLIPLSYCIYMFHSYFRAPAWKTVLCSVLTFALLLTGYLIVFVLIYMIIFYFGNLVN